MSTDGIDASIGLTFSLELFKRYQKSGVLQAEIPRMPGVHGRCIAYLHLVDGLVVSVYVEDHKGRRYSSDKETLCHLDDERGPYEWVLRPQSIQSGTSNQTQPSSPPRPALKPTSIPRVVSAFPWDRLNGWTPQQRDALYIVLTSINGTRTLENIADMVRLPLNLVEELMRILLDLNVITISTY